MRWVLVVVIVGAAGAASADPSPTTPATSSTTAPAQSSTPLANAVVPHGSEDAPRACRQPACDAAATTPGAQFVPVDVKIPIGGIAIASMEGLWLRRGLTLRDKPIMLSPIVVGGALTLSLGGSF